MILLFYAYLFLFHNYLCVFVAVPSKCTGPIVVTEVQQHSISIKWKPPKEDGGSPLTGYIVEKREAGHTFWVRIEKVAPEITALKAMQLNEKTEYYFRVIAENKVGQSAPLETNDSTMAKSPYGMYLI